MQRLKNTSERTVHCCKYVSDCFAETMFFCSLIQENPERSENLERSYKSKPSCIFSDYRKIASAAKDRWFSKFDESSGEKIKCLWWKETGLNRTLAFSFQHQNTISAETWATFDKPHLMRGPFISPLWSDLNTDLCSNRAVLTSTAH